MCGALRPSDAGKKVVLMGWVNRRRDLGSIIFVDLRDRTGVTQVVFNRAENPNRTAGAVEYLGGLQDVADLLTVGAGMSSSIPPPKT